MTSESFKKTVAQEKAVKLIASSSAKNICLEGGSRAGKSFEIMREIIIRASIAPNSNHLICRETFNSVKRSIWQKTLPDVMRICFPSLTPKYNNQDYCMTLANGSNIWIAGLDDGKKLERLLGTEYSTLWFNESNQIPYPAVTKLKTRLAEKNCLVKKSYFDLNPTKTTSWVYQVFHQKINPIDGEMLSDPENYLVIKMNPQDNLENLDEDYIKMLEALPEKERLRFLEGLYDSDNTGAAVYAFNDEYVSDSARRLQGTVYCGVDFNIQNNADVLISHHANGIYVWDEQLIAGDTFQKANGLIKKGVSGATMICDSTGKARRTSGMSDHEILKQAGFNVVYKTNPAIKDKIANLNRAFMLGLIKIHPRCKKLLRDLKQLEWKSDGLKLDSGPDDSLGHLTDCLAYAVWYLYPLKDMSGIKINSSPR